MGDEQEPRGHLTKAKAVVVKLKQMKLNNAAERVEEQIAEPLTNYAYPVTHWRPIRTHNPLKRIIGEIRRRTRVVGALPDGKSALLFAAACLRHIAVTKRGTRYYLRDGFTKRHRHH